MQTSLVGGSMTHYQQMSSDYVVILWTGQAGAGQVGELYSIITTKNGEIIPLLITTDLVDI
jgi:hypothetical protein